MTNFPITINGVQIMSDDAYKTYKRTRSKSQTAQYIMRKTACKENEALDVVEDVAHMYELQSIPSNVTVKDYSKGPMQDVSICCPKCGSTTITTGARGVNVVWGLIGASKTVNRCAKCGHTWKPKG